MFFCILQVKRMYSGHQLSGEFSPLPSSLSCLVSSALSSNPAKVGVIPSYPTFVAVFVTT